VELQFYDGRRELTCILCGAVFEQQYVAVALLDGSTRLGDLDPYCLAREPGEAAERARVRGADTALANRVASLPRWPVTLTELQRAEKRELRQRFPCLREDDLRRLVEERYEEVLAADAG
jgi:hypothetical protein